MRGTTNLIKTGILFAALTALLIAIGYLVAGRSGVILFFFISLIMNLGSYWFSDKIALAMSHSQPIDESQAPNLYAEVREVAQKMNIPTPNIYMSPDMQPNAFATGRNPSHAAISFTQGILQMLNRNELKGVIAHELSHVKNRDVLISTIAAVVAGTISSIANIFAFGGFSDDNNDRNPFAAILLIILAPLAAAMLQFAISRSREFAADETGAEYTGKPMDLADALIKIDNAANQIPMNVNPAISSLYIENPLRGEGVMTLFSTHPSTADRVARLQEMSQRPM